MEESRVRYSKLSMITATKRFNICRTRRRRGEAYSSMPSYLPSRSVHKHEEVSGQ